MKVNLYAKHIGKSPEQIEEDIRRPKYFSPSEALEYGIIDKVPAVDLVWTKVKIIILLKSMYGSWVSGTLLLSC